MKNISTVIIVLLGMVCVFFSCNISKKTESLKTEKGIMIMSDALMLLDAESTRCLVAHITKDGVFTCDFKGVLYPESIYDTSIKKWFIKMKGIDSVFYYKTDTVEVYVWDGSFYTQKGDGWSRGIGYEYNGKDTLKESRQLWRPKK
jgi:hypothetical protein